MAEPTKKDSTNELPMCDIGEAIKIATAIHNKGLELASLPEVARGCGYANPTSTPFYRRIVAARLFQFIGTPKPGLTKLANDYLKPSTEDAKQAALTQAIMGIKIYAAIVNEHIARKINLELVTNRLEKDPTLLISRACAKVCASTLENSLKIAGFISADGTVAIPLSAGVKIAGQLLTDPPPPPPPPPPPGDDGQGLKNEISYEIYILPLSNGRKITVKAPANVTQQEVERLNKWTKFTLFLDWNESGIQTESK
jgi:hypothetical protein